MNPEDVFRDVRKAVVERKRVFVSRSEVNGKIRWIIEIENQPFGSQMNSHLRGMLDHFSSLDTHRDLDRFGDRRNEGATGDE